MPHHRSGSVTLDWVPIDDPVAAELIAEVQQEYVLRYGGPDATPVVASEFASPEGGFVVLRVDGEPAGCAGVRRLDLRTAELKRMYVRPDHRRQGLAGVLLAAAERRAAETGCTRVVLETGTAQPEALAFYPARGYLPTEPFGHYRCSPNSRSFGKNLSG